MVSVYATCTPLQLLMNQSYWKQNPHKKLTRNLETVLSIVTPGDYDNNNVFFFCPRFFVYLGLALQLIILLHVALSISSRTLIVIRLMYRWHAPCNLLHVVVSSFFQTISTFFSVCSSHHMPLPFQASVRGVGCNDLQKC